MQLSARAVRMPSYQTKAVVSCMRPAAGTCHNSVAARPGRRLTCFATGAPSSSTSNSTTLERGTTSSYKRSPTYKVMLHNDSHNRREYVVKVLVKTFDNFGVDDAIGVMQEAHETGIAMVVACPQEEAEAYCETLRGNGLSSTIEPGC